ncbi:hypothetical protein BCU68_11255 [Vibrio sp. 10N.286.49.B3]|nr:hypothetical protein BCU68_11255 [Vibrio sp. 10N.286.49.B3]
MTKAKSWSTLILSVFAVMGLSACADNTAGLRIDGQNHKVIFNDNVLHNRLQIDDMTTDQVNGHARGIVRLMSNYKGDQHIQYRFYWYDDAGLEVNTKQGPWKQAIVRGFESYSISEVSVNPSGTQYRVQIRESNDQ